jgi:hypothetical protein
MAVRCADCTRRQHRNREASETRCAQTADASLSDFGTGDVSPSNGFHCNSNSHVTSNGNGNGNRNRRCAGNGNGNGNGRCAGLHATATVAARNVKGNCNGRCAVTQDELFLHNEERVPKRRITVKGPGVIAHCTIRRNWHVAL